MQRVTIGRYDDTTLKQEYAGWIGGVRDDGSEWIMWLDGVGSPEQFWPHRDETGAVIGEPILLAPHAGNDPAS